METRPLPLGIADHRHHYLASLADEVHRTYFHKYPPLTVRWGQQITRKKRRSIRLGSYNHITTEIRIHPLLDSPGHSGVLHPVDHPPRVPAPRPRRQPQPPLSRAGAPVPLLPRIERVDSPAPLAAARHQAQSQSCDAGRPGAAADGAVLILRGLAAARCRLSVDCGFAALSMRGLRAS